MPIAKDLCQLAIPILRQIFEALRLFQSVEQAATAQSHLVELRFVMRLAQAKFKFKACICRKALAPLTVQTGHDKSVVVAGLCAVGHHRLSNTTDGLVF